MKKVRTKLLFLIFLLLFILPQRSYSEVKVKTIVFFFSQNESAPAYQSILEGFHTTFLKYFNEPCNILTEYLDVVRTTDNEYLKHIVTLYNKNFDGNTLDLIITVGPGTYPLLKKSGLHALNTTPTIVIDLDKFNPEKQSEPENENIFEVNLKLNFGQTLRNVFKLFPDYRNVYFICGSSSVDHYYTKLAREAAQTFESAYNFKYITGITMDSTLQIVQKIPANSIVVIPSFLTDVNNAPISTSFALNSISNQCSAPLFTMSDNFIKKGGIGGLVFSFVEVGKVAGRVSCEILQGKPIKEITVNKDDFYRYIYDWKQLKRWDLVGSKVIPANSIFINKKFNFLSEYRWYILVFLLFMVAETFLIIYLIKLNRNQKEVTEQKARLEQIYRDLIREDRLSKMAELTASLSHELNQPLTAILYNAQAGMRFLNSGKLNTPQAKEILGNIIEDNKRAAELISSIRSLMKLETREKEVVNLNSLIEETIALFNFEAIKHHIKISVILEDQTLFVFGDKIQLQQVILNFLSNAELAIETIDPASRTLKIVQVRNSDLVTVSVKDSGPGIQSDVMEKIFKPFITTRKNGFGIGLAISSSIIERHDGKIWAENVDGGGAKFSFSLKII